MRLSKWFLNSIILIWPENQFPGKAKYILKQLKKKL